MHVAPALFGAAGGVLGGAERYSLELARHMAEAVPTTLVTFGPKPAWKRIGCLEVRVLSRHWAVRGQASNPVNWFLWKELLRADVIHCHQQHLLSSSLSALFARLTRRRVFVSDLGGGGWDFSAYFSTDRWYHGHLHISEYSRRIFGHEDRPWAHVILGGVDTQKFKPGLFGSTGGPVLFVGRLLPHKGINYLIEGLPPDMDVEVIGQTYDPDFFALLKQLATGKRVRFRQDCDDAGLVEAYQRACCVVLPSVYRTMSGQETRVPELLGQTLLEGMACGKPVICTQVASMPEIVTDSETGFVVSPNDPQAIRQRLNWLREHPDKARTMGERARALVQDKFAWPCVVRRCLDAYAASRI